MSKPLDLDAIQKCFDEANPSPSTYASNEALLALARSSMPALIAELREALAKLAKLPHHCGDEACRRHAPQEPSGICDCYCDACVDAEDHGIFVHKKATT